MREIRLFCESGIANKKNLLRDRTLLGKVEH